MSNEMFLCLLVAGLTLFSILGIGYQCIPCRWGGPHDWENVGPPALLSVNAGTLRVYDRVCLTCHKIDMQATPILESQRREVEVKKAREQRAREIMEANG